MSRLTPTPGRGHARNVMRIAAIEPILVDVPLREPVHGVHGTTAVQRSVLVRVETDTGAEGWGNVDPTPGYSAVSAEQVHATVSLLGPSLVGADGSNLHAVLARMDQAILEASEAKAVIEMALVDLKARTLGVPVHSLLGGRVKNTITLNAWIGTVPPERAADEALAWSERGFRTAKIKVSGPGDEGVARVAAVRRSVGERMALRVDFNESLTVEQALAFIPRLEPYGLTLVEQPVSRHDIAGLARIRHGTRIPLM